MKKRILYLFIYMAVLNLLAACSSSWDEKYADTPFEAFHTIPQPSVSEVSVGDITKHSATLSFAFSSASVDVTEYGVCYSSSSNAPTKNDNALVQQGGGRGGNPSFEVSGLASKTTYYVRAFVVSVLGTQYGEAIEFTTQISAPNEGDNGTPQD